MVSLTEQSARLIAPPRSTGNNANRPPRQARRKGGRPPGFMLIEAALTTVIIGVAVVALLAVIGAATRTNGGNREMTRAVFLAQEVRELLAPLPAAEDDGRFGPELGETSLAAYDDLDDFDGLSFTPPINAQRQALGGAEWAGWTETITVANVDPDYLAGSQPLPDGSTDVVRVTVTVRKDTRLMHEMSWVVAVTVDQGGGG